MITPKALSEIEFKASTEGKTFNVTKEADAKIDIWPYVREVKKFVEIPEQALKNEWVEYVYRSQFNHYDHVLIPLGRPNVFLVIVVDRTHGSIFGHRLLDLNAEYGIQSPSQADQPS